MGGTRLQIASRVRALQRAAGADPAQMLAASALYRALL